MRTRLVVCNWGRWAVVAVISVLMCACGGAGSQQSNPEQSRVEQAKPEQPKTEQAKADPQNTAAQTAPEEDDLPAALRTSWKGDLDEIAKRRYLRVLVPYRRPEFFYMSGRPAGILFEAFQEIERLLNTKYKTKADNRIVVAYVPSPTAQMAERMTKQYADVVAGSVSITEEAKAIADFTIPTMSGLKIIPVTGPGAPELKSVEDLSGKDVWIMPHTRLKHDLDAFNAKLKAQGKAPVKMNETDPALDLGDIAEMVNAGVYPITLMQSIQAEFWGHVFEGIKPRKDLVITEDVQLGWAIQKGTPQLKAFLDDFLKTHGLGTAFGNTVMRRYLRDAKYVKNAVEASELQKFRALAPLFREYSDKYDLDYLLMAAQGYQESRLDQNVKSPVGAIGIMQVMPSTAAGHPVKIPNIEKQENNIHAGIRLMHFLIQDHYNEPGLDRINRMLFAIGAYNTGPGNIRKCRAKAQEMGYDPNKWFGNVEVAVAKLIGRETTQYVANIYKYYLSYKLVTDMNIKRREIIRKATSGTSKTE